MPKQKLFDRYDIALIFCGALIGALLRFENLYLMKHKTIKGYTFNLSKIDGIGPVDTDINVIHGGISAAYKPFFEVYINGLCVRINGEQYSDIEEYNKESLHLLEAREALFDAWCLIIGK